MGRCFATQFALPCDACECCPFRSVDRAGAEFSGDRTYRFRLWRSWGNGIRLVVIGLNPSTADENKDDPTIRRCIYFARRWGFNGLEMLNLFGFRATDPKALKRHHTGALQDKNLAVVGAAIGANASDGVLAAWGNHGYGYTAPIMRMFDLAGLPVACFGMTKTGMPRHPLYQRSDARPVKFHGSVLAQWWDDERRFPVEESPMNEPHATEGAPDRVADTADNDEP